MQTEQIANQQSFLLTRPVRGATRTWLDYWCYVCISTHTPHAGRDLIAGHRRGCSIISTHTPLARRDA